MALFNIIAFIIIIILFLSGLLEYAIWAVVILLVIDGLIAKMMN